MDNVKKSGLYAEDCREWDRKASESKDWATFKKYFAWVFKDIRRSARTSQQVGYAANVEESNLNAEMFTKIQ